MKKFALFTALALLLAACAHTPEEIVKFNNVFIFNGRHDAAQTAACIAEASMNMFSGVSAQRWEKPYGYDVIAQMTGTAATTFAVYQVRSAGKGSEVRAYISPNVMTDNRTFAEKAIGGCLL